MNDLEMLLRSTLAGRAETIDHGPQWAGPQSLASAPGPNRNKRWLAVVAAAAAVVAIGAGVVAVRDADHHSTPPASPTPTPSGSSPAPTTDPTPSSSPTVTKHAPPPTKVTELAACPTTLPSAWDDALQNSVVDVGGRTVWPLAVAPDKSLVVLRDAGVTPGSKREVLYVSPSGAASVVYTVKDPDHTSVELGAVSGPWLALGLWNNPRPAKNTEPGSSSIGLQGIVVVNLENLSSELIAGTDTALTQSYTGPSIQSMAVSNGVLYWDEEKTYGGKGTLKSYNLSTHAEANVYSGTIGYVVANPAGVGWRDNTRGAFVFAVRYQLPSIVKNAMTPFSEYRLQTDGTNYAWIDSPTDVYWWHAGLAKPVHLTLPNSMAINTDDMHGGVSVSGHMLLTDALPSVVIDMQTGAVAPFPATGLFGTQQRGEFIGNTGSVYDGLAFTGTAGHFENGYWADTATSALRLDISALPDVTC